MDSVSLSGRAHKNLTNWTPAGNRCMYGPATEHDSAKFNALIGLAPRPRQRRLLLKNTLGLGGFSQSHCIDGIYESAIRERV